MTLLARRTQAVKATDFKRDWGTPELINESRSLKYRAERYARNWELYSGVAYTNDVVWGPYRKAFNLYRGTRHIWDIAHELVEFYVAHVWSGFLAADGLNLPDGVPNAVPFAEDTDPKLAQAAATLFKWWNFQSMKDMIVRYTAAVGELLTIMDDDSEAGKVRVEMVWPGYVTDVRLDMSGQLLYFKIEYSYYDRDDNLNHTYSLEVDKEWISTYRDSRPYNFDTTPIPEGTDADGATFGLGYGSMYSDLVNQGIDGGEEGYRIENPYGFVPARWWRHIQIMGVRGEPAMYAAQAQMDEINSLLSHTIDKAHTSLESPILIAGNVTPNRLSNALSGLYGTAKRVFTSDLDEPSGVREELNILEGPQGTSMSTIELKIADAGIAVDRLVAAVEKKCPEVVFYTEMRQMTQVTGPSAGTLLGDVDRKVRQVAPGYDANLRGLIQMGIAIAGMRLAEGADGWADPTDEQKHFEGFDLESYAKGDLNFDIMPRPLLPPTAKDKLEVIQMKKLALPFIPETVLAKEAGYTDEAEVQKWVDDYNKKQEEAAQKQMEMMQQSQAAKAAGQHGNGKPGDNITPIKRQTGAPAGGPQKGSPTRNRRSANE